MKTVIKVEGMSCSHCEDAVKKAVLAFEGVRAADVDLTAGIVTISHDEGLPLASVAESVEDLGFDVEL